MTQREYEPFELARVEAVLIGYDTRWAEDMREYDVLAVEAEFRAPLINPESGRPSQTWQRGGKLDAVLRERRTGRNLICEHKSTSEDLSPGSPYWARLRMDGQISGYFLGAEALGFPAQACLYDVIRRPQLRPLGVTKTRKEPETPGAFRSRCIEDIAANHRAYFQRGEVVRLDEEMRDAAFDDWQTAQQLHEAERIGRAPRNPDACFKWNRPCSFFDVCTGCASTDDPRRFRRSEANPELEDAGGLPVLSASRLRVARLCLRMHRFQYIDRIRPVEEPDTLRFGSLLHLGLQRWLEAKDGERLEAALDAVRGGARVQPELSEASHGA